MRCPFLLMGKDIKAMKDCLKKFLKDFNTPIKGLGFCTNPYMEETALFLKALGGRCRIWNISDKPLRVNAFSTLENEDAPFFSPLTSF